MMNDAMLDGLTILDMSQGIAGPYCGLLLGQQGARVIKVEPPTGDWSRQMGRAVDGQTAISIAYNAGKESVVLDTRTPQGRKTLIALAEKADIIIQNFRPGVAASMGVEYEVLAKRNPKLVYCSISAYGHTGPDAHRAGFGLIAEAKSGIMQMVGTPGEPPPLLRISLGDMYTGIHAVAAINAALLGRVKSGQGQHIDMALYDTLVSMHEYAVQCYTLSGGQEVPVQTGHDMPTSTLYGVFRAQDGDLVIAAQVDDAWKRFAALVEQRGGPAGFAADARFHTSAGRNAHRLDILAVVKPWVAAQRVADVLAMLDAIDVPGAKVQRIDEVLADPQIQARGMVLEQDHPVLGKIKLPNLPFHFSGCDTTITQVAPDLGQHNTEIAASVGFSAEQIAAMQQDGVLYSA